MSGEEAVVSTNPNKIRKATYFSKLNGLLNTYNKILIVNADNVGSKLMQNIRVSLRGHGALLMGKNTMMRKAIRGMLPTNPGLESVLPLVKGNIGFIFTNQELASIRDIINENKIEAAARVGAVSQVTYVIPAGVTSLEPTQTQFLQALNIATKITKGTIEILNDVTILKIGQKVGASEAALLQKLDLKPFKYGLTPLHVYENGDVYNSSVLDIKDSDVLNSFRTGLTNLTALSLQTGLLNAASFPHVILNGFKDLLHISIATSYTFKQSEKIKDMIANPGKFAAAAPAPAAAAAAPAKAAAAAAPAKKEESEEEGVAFDLF